jgi:arylsulfatase A-like enzyme
MDYHIGELILKLANLGLLKNSIIIITSDHGESFGEHNGWAHGLSPYEEQIKVPLLIYCPNLPNHGTIIEEQVSLISIMPTILKFLNINFDSNLDIFNLLKGKKIKNKYAYAERYLPDGSYRMVRTNDWKYILLIKVINHKLEIKEKFFNLKKDPHELKNLIDKNPEELNVFKKKYSFILKKIGINNFKVANKIKESDSFKINDRLKAFGYFN